MLSSSGRTFLVKMALRATLALATTPKKTPSRDSDPGTNAAMSSQEILYSFKVKLGATYKEQRHRQRMCVCVRGGGGERERQCQSQRERDREREGPRDTVNHLPDTPS